MIKNKRTKVVETYETKTPEFVEKNTIGKAMVDFKENMKVNGTLFTKGRHFVDDETSTYLKQTALENRGFISFVN